MKIVRNTVLPFLMAGAVLAGGCSDVASSGGSSVTIKLTDAAGDLAEAWVEISEIYLQGTTAVDGERVSLFRGSTGMIDLLTLPGEKTVDLISDVVVPEGTYSQLRFVVSKARIVTEDGREFSTDNGKLHCPSCTTPSGLKVNLPGGSVRIEGGSNVLVVDFDVSQSFGSERGKSGRWVMHPVMHASGFQTSGGIAGTVTMAEGKTIPACGGVERDLSAVTPTATAGEIVRSGITEASGAYGIAFVAPGSYGLGLARVGYENGDSLIVAGTASPASVDVGSGKTATADFRITDAICKAAS
ncbi:hypothetical protein BH23GEM3_BH23GEM3_01390 [soil metagenome]